MVKEIISIVLKDMVLILRKNNDFFSLNKPERKSVLKNFNANYPSSLIDYLLEATGENFMKDMRDLLFYVSENKISAKSKLIDAIISFITSDIAKAMDGYSNKGYVGDVYLSEDLAISFGNYTEQEISREIFEFIKNHIDIPLIIVQAPKDLDNRSEVRKHFANKYPNSFVEFQKNNDLLGGIRIFVDGEIIDSSWATKVKSLELINIK